MTHKRNAGKKAGNRLVADPPILQRKDKDEDQEFVEKVEEIDEKKGTRPGRKANGPQKLPG